MSVNLYRGFFKAVNYGFIALHTFLMLYITIILQLIRTTFMKNSFGSYQSFKFDDNTVIT